MMQRRAPYLFVQLAVQLLALTFGACKPTSEGFLWEQNDAPATVRAAVQLSGGMATLRAPGLTGVTSLTWTSEPFAGVSATGDTVVARIRPESAALVVSQHFVCSGNFTDWAGELPCRDSRAPQARDPDAADFVSSSVFRGIACGSWYNESPIWVLRFDMKLEARTPEAAAAVDGVIFDAWPDYRPSFQEVQSPRTPGVWESSRGWLTKVPSWTTTGTTVRLKSGASVKVDRAVTPPDPKDPARPLGGSCVGVAPQP